MAGLQPGTDDHGPHGGDSGVLRRFHPILVFPNGAHPLLVSTKPGGQRNRALDSSSCVGNESFQLVALILLQKYQEWSHLSEILAQDPANS
jgi:hypothetical protein